MPYCPDCLVDIGGQPHCATCKTARLLDLRSGVDTFSLRLASGWQRFGGMFLDGLLINIPLYVIYAIMLFSQQGGNPSPYLSFIGLPFMFAQFFYEALMTAYKNGQTLGRMAVKARIVRPDGSSISSGQAWGRAALRMVLGCLWIVDYIPFFFTKEKTTIHDMLAGTRVIDLT
jgi:uncharacterized RDD family membrane protein YckC